MAEEQFFQNQRAPWLTIDKTAGASVTTPPNAGDVRLYVDSSSGALSLKDESGNTFALAPAGTNNYSASTAPTSTDDSTGGYVVGSLWVDTTADEAYVCLDATASNAVWGQVTVGASDHKLDDHAAPDDNTDLNASTSAHGLLPKLSNTATQYLDGTGAWDTPDHGELGGLTDDDHPQYIKDSEFTAADTVLLGTGSGTFIELQHSFSKTAAPGTGDDNTGGWAVGSMWIDTTNDKVYIAMDVTTAAAVWQEVGAGGGGGGASAMDDLTDADTTTVTPSTGDPLLWDGTNWVPGTAVSITTGTIGAKAYHNTTQSVPNATYTAVQFNAEDWDTHAFHDTATNNTRFTIPTGEDGKYLVSATVSFAGNATGQRAVVFYVDGAVTSSSLSNSGDQSSDAEYVQNTDVLDLAAGQYVEVYVYQQSTGALNIGSATREFASQMAIVKLNSSITGSSALPTDSASKTDSNVAVGASVDAIDTSIDLTVSAEAGDVLLVSASGKWDTDGSQIPCLDAATIVSAAAVNWLSGVGSPDVGNRGVQAWIGENFTNGRVGFGGSVSYVVQAGDIENGTVTLRVYGWEGGAGSNQLLCNSGGPFQWSVVNLRAVGAPRATVGDGAPSNPAVGQLWYDSDATPSGAGGTGTTFPTSPTTGDTYRRSDIDYRTFFYDGTRWLSEEVYTVGSYEHDTNVTLNQRIPLRTDYAIYAMRWEWIYRMSVGGASWDISISTLDFEGDAVELATQAITGYTASNIYAGGAAINTVVDATGGNTTDSIRGLLFSITENSGSSAFYGGFELFYRIIAT